MKYRPEKLVEKDVLLIKQHNSNEKRKCVRQGIKPDNNKSLWEAVKIAKDINIDCLPKIMHNNGVLIK